jgi:hypothetical protein
MKIFIKPLLLILLGPILSSGNPRQIRPEDRTVGLFGNIGTGLAGVGEKIYAFVRDPDAPVSITGGKVFGENTVELKIHNHSTKTITHVQWVVTPYDRQSRWFSSNIYLSSGKTKIRPDKGGRVSDKVRSWDDDKTYVVQLELVSFEDQTSWRNPTLIDRLDMDTLRRQWNWK